MNFKKHIVTIAAAVTLVAGVTHAAQATEERGGKRHHRGGGEAGAFNRHAGRLATALNLTDAQKEQAKAIREKHRVATADLRTQMKDLQTQLRAARQSNDTAEAQRLAALREPLMVRAREAWSAERSELRSILTPEQQAKLEEMQKSFAAKREGARSRQQ